MSSRSNLSRREFTSISASHFATMSKKAIELQPIQKEIALHEVNILSPTSIEYRGKEISMSKEGFGDFTKLVGINKSFGNRFTKNFGDPAMINLITRMKTILATSPKKSTINLVVSPTDKQIIGINKGGDIKISNESYLKMAERSIDKYNLTVSNFAVSDTGNVIINTANPAPWEINGMKDETFFGGVGFSNSFSEGFNLHPFLTRLICANGNSLPAFKEDFTLSSLGQKEAQDFLLQMEELAKRQFRPLGFEDQVRRAANINASFAEMETAYNTIRDNAFIDSMVLEEFIPFKATKDAYFKHGNDVLNMNKEQKKNAPTGMSLWDLINVCTDFSSHDHGIKVDGYRRLTIQKETGAMMSKKSFDMENIVSSPFAMICK